MPKTKVVNKTEGSITLKEGTAGVFRTVCDNLPKDGEYTIEIDPNATYREYWCVMPPNDMNRVVLSSDDCMDYKEVHVKVKREGDNVTYTWDAVKRRSHEKKANDNEPSTTSSPSLGFLSKVWNKMKGSWSS